MKLLILGGIKFVGKELLKQAIEQKHDITLISLDEPAGLNYVNWIKVDRNDEPALTEALKDKEFDCVIDNIAYNGHHVAKLLNAVRGKTKRYVLTSTVDTYLHDKLKLADEVDDKKLSLEEIKEDTPFWIKYSIGKRAAERVLRNDNSSIEKVIIRPAVVMGPEDGIDNFDVPRSLIWPAKIMDNEPILLYENDMDTFILAHISDVARALLLVAKHPKAVNQVYNVVGDTIWNTETFVSKLIEVYKSKSKIHKVYLSQLKESGIFGDNPIITKSYGRSAVHKFQLFSNSRLKELGWRPTSDKEMLLSLFSNQERLLAVKEKLQPLRNLEIEFAKTLSQDEDSGYIQGHCTVSLSKIAIGTHRGEYSSEVDNDYKNAIKMSVSKGINVIDTAINYRNCRSEMIIGETLRELIDSDTIERNEIFVITKGGFMANEYNWPLINKNESQNKHSIRPGFIKHCLNRSYKNLKLKTIDLYLLHNPEIALNYMSQEEFYTTMLQNFVMLEDEVRVGRIRSYGFATWHGLRLPIDHKNYLDLNRILEIAEIAAGGKQHHFEGIELPINVLNSEAITYSNQWYQGKLIPTGSFARANNLKLFTSNSVIYGEDSSLISAHYSFDYEFTPAQKSLLFLKSLPEITSAIVGMKRSENVEQAIEVLNFHDLTQEQQDFTINKCIFKRIN